MIKKSKVPGRALAIQNELIEMKARNLRELNNNVTLEIDSSEDECTFQPQVNILNNKMSM